MIATAALKAPNGLIYSMPRPSRHCHIIRAMVEAGHKTPIVYEQGFLTSNGKFVDRERAKDQALIIYNQQVQLNAFQNL